MSESVKALAMALEVGSRKGPPPMACCPHCPGEVPLISTFRWPGAEFYCLDCGGLVSFVGPKAAVETPELTADYEARLAEWKAHVAGQDDAEEWLRQRVTTS